MIRGHYYGMFQDDPDTPLGSIVPFEAQRGLMILQVSHTFSWAHVHGDLAELRSFARVSDGE